MRGLVVVSVLLLVSVAIATLFYIGKDTKPSVADDSTVYTPTRSASRDEAVGHRRNRTRAGVTCPSVGDGSTVYTLTRSASETLSSDKPLTDKELDELIEKGLLTEDERRELKHLQNQLNSTE